MATGWAKDGAVQDQIDDPINDAVTRARDTTAAHSPYNRRGSKDSQLK